MSDKPEIVIVRVTDLDVPFWRLVNLLVKVAIAAIPALIVLAIYAVALALFFGAMLSP